MHMVAIYAVWYNFVKQRKTPKGLSPAMAAGVSEMLRSVADLAEMVDATTPKPGERGPYEKRGRRLARLDGGSMSSSDEWSECGYSILETDLLTRIRGIL